MAIPYNPSSFATNKTILQAIEELKNYLKQNPCYKVYYVSTAYVVGTTTYNLSDVDDPDDTMTAGDIVFFNNSYYASVTNKDTNTFDIDPAVDFRGATGSTGSQGVSVTGATINASGHLIISLSDGTSIDAGYLPANYDNTVTISSTSGTLTNDEYNKLLNDDSHIIYSGGVYPKDSEDLSTIVYRRVTSGSHASAVYKIEVNKSTKAYSVSSKGLTTNPEDIDSYNESAGAVLLADGDGGAEWGTVSSGYENTVSITATSGTFSDSDFAKLGYGDSTIVYTDAYSVSTVYKLKLETASILEFEAIDAASRNNLKLIDVNKTTKAYSMTSIAMITSATISSGSATSGKVLTANGSGGCSWENAGGTSFTKFTKDLTSATTPQKLRAIWEIFSKCKGHIIPFSCQLTCVFTDSTTMTLHCNYRAIDIRNSGGTRWLVFNSNYYSSGQNIFFFAYLDETLSTGAQKVLTNIASDGTISNKTLSYINTLYIVDGNKIEYYNDVEITW